MTCSSYDITVMSIFRLANHRGDDTEQSGAMFHDSPTVAKGLDYYVKSMLNSMLINKDFLTWLLIGWRLCCQPIRCQVWKPLLTWILTWKFLSNSTHWSVEHWFSLQNRNCKVFKEIQLFLKFVHFLVLKRRTQIQINTIGPVSYFNNNFSVVNQIWWKTTFILALFLTKWLLQHFAHGMTTVLLWHVQKIVTNRWLRAEWQQNCLFIEFGLWWKNH